MKKVAKPAVRNLAMALIGVAIIALTYLGWNWRSLSEKAAVGAAYGARMTCSCRYVEGRSMQSCKGDTEPGMWIVAITDKPYEQGVSAHVPLLADRIAHYKTGFGCVLDRK